MNVPVRRYCAEQIDLLVTEAILRFNIYCLSITVLMVPLILVYSSGF